MSEALPWIGAFIAALSAKPPAGPFVLILGKYILLLNRVLTKQQISWMRRKKFKLDILGGD